MRRLLPSALALALAGLGCTYLRTAAKQAYLAEHPEDRPAPAAEADSPGDPPAGGISSRALVRGLDDEIFSSDMTALGLYEPRSFLERAPSLLYALEEEDLRRIPVIFVHGISGGPRDFAALLAKLDRSRYQPWFFYYPSGASLGAMGEAFHRLLLAEGSPVRGGPLVIVAHSMGGLVAREALDRCSDAAEEVRVARLITIAAPFGGYPGAAGTLGPVRVDSWQDLVPDSAFIAQLHRRPLPSGLEFDLFFTYGDTRRVRLGENSDGVVPLASQLSSAAQDEAAFQFGLNDTHTGVLRDAGAIERILAAVEGPPRTKAP